MIKQSKYLTVAALACTALVIVSCKSIPRPGGKIDDKVANDRFSCVGDSRSAYGVGLELDYEGEELAKAKTEFDATYEVGSINKMLALEALTELNRESIIKGYNDCINGNAEPLKELNEKLKEELEAKKNN